MDIIVDDRRKNNLAAGHLQPTYVLTSRYFVSYEGSRRFDKVHGQLFDILVGVLTV